MSLLSSLRGLGLAVQRPGQPGPLTLALNAMSQLDPAGQPHSPIGAEVARLIGSLSIRVAFLPTGGSGITPWRRLIVLDTGYRGQGQASTPGRVGLVAHELSHLLQRELDDPELWPGGGLRPSPRRRWLGDSTNYMEALAYAVGTSVEVDLRAAAGLPALPEKLDSLATLLGGDAANATRYVVKLFPENPIYRQNHRIEKRLPDRRIPPEGWQHWFGVMGFGAAAIAHLAQQAGQGRAKTISEEDIMGGNGG